MGDADADVFTGLAVKLRRALRGERFVPSEHVPRIWADRVEVELDGTDRTLPPFEDAPVVRVEPAERRGLLQPSVRTPPAPNGVGAAAAEAARMPPLPETSSRPLHDGAPTVLYYDASPPSARGKGRPRACSATTTSRHHLVRPELPSQACHLGRAFHRHPRMVVAEQMLASGAGHASRMSSASGRPVKTIVSSSEAISAAAATLARADRV